MLCARCGQELDYVPIKDILDKGKPICGKCAEELSEESDRLVQEADAERIALANEANREAYEEEQRARHFDTGGGWRYS